MSNRIYYPIIKKIGTFLKFLNRYLNIFNFLMNGTFLILKQVYSKIILSFHFITDVILYLKLVTLKKDVRKDAMFLIRLNVSM